MTRLTMAVGVWMLGAAVLSGSAGQLPAQATEEAPATLAVAGRSSANASIAASGTFVAAVWGASTEAGETDIFAAVSRDGGHKFSSPVRVNDPSAGARLSGEQPPRVSLVSHAGSNPSIVVVWTAQGSQGTRLETARSDDGGRSFGRPATVPGSAAAGNRGWESMAVDPSGHVVVAWLDHRALAHENGTTMHMAHMAAHDASASAAEADGVARAQLSKLYVAGLDEAIRPQVVAAGVCYCCKTALATGPDGSIYAAWRNVYPGNIRDIAFSVSHNDGRTFAAPVRVSDDHWVLNGCPENGPALAVDAHSVVHVVWPTLVAGSTPASEPTLELFHASTTDGRHFSPRQLIPTEGTPRHPWIASGANGRLLIVWDEAVRGTRQVAISEAAPDDRGTLRFTRIRSADFRQGEYPVAAAVDGGFVAAWASGPAEQSVIRVERIVGH